MDARRASVVLSHYLIFLTKTNKEQHKVKNSKKLKGLFAATVAAVGLTAVAAEPSVTINEVAKGDPASKVTIRYTISGVGTEPADYYRVVFDFTAGDQTASVTNDAAKMTNGTATNEIDIAQLFGGEIADGNAKVKVALVQVPTPAAGQLWKGGPIWADHNVGGSSPKDKGKYYKFEEAQTAAKGFGTGWRLPTKAEFEALIANCDVEAESERVDSLYYRGVRFTGRNEYASNCIYLLNAGEKAGVAAASDSNGYYWSSTPHPTSGSFAYALCTYTWTPPAKVDYALKDTKTYSARPVRDAPDEPEERIVATDETSLESKILIRLDPPQNGYDTAEEASNALEKAEFVPSAEVKAKLGKGSDVLTTYCNMFTLEVEPFGESQWVVAARLKPEALTNVMESAQEATRQIPIADIAALPLNTPTNVTAKGCGVPGFFYSFYSGGAVTNLRAVAAEKGRNVLCGPGKDVTFEGVVKPSDTAGFFSIGAKETPGVQPSDSAVPAGAMLITPAFVEE